MVVDLAVRFKVALVYAGSNHGFVRDLDGGYRLSGLIKGLLDADVIIGSVQLAAHGQHISSQIDHGVPDAFLFQVIFDPVGNISFGDSSQINARMRVGEFYRIIPDDDVFIIHMAYRLCDGFRRRD